MLNYIEALVLAAGSTTGESSGIPNGVVTGGIVVVVLSAFKLIDKMQDKLGKPKASSSNSTGNGFSTYRTIEMLSEVSTLMRQQVETSRAISTHITELVETLRTRPCVLYSESEAVEKVSKRLLRNCPVIKAGSNGT